MYNIHTKKCTNPKCSAWLIITKWAHQGTQHSDHDIEHCWHQNQKAPRVYIPGTTCTPSHNKGHWLCPVLWQQRWGLPVLNLYVNRIIQHSLFWFWLHLLNSCGCSHSSCTHCYIVFCRMDLPKLKKKLFYCWWTFGLLPSNFWQLWMVLLWTRLPVFWWTRTPLSVGYVPRDGVAGS